MRRVHGEQPDTPRKIQTFDVPDDIPNNQPVYCSIECACYDGAYSITKGWLNKEKTE